MLIMPPFLRCGATSSLADDGVQLAAGHFIAEKFSMVAVYPRPDAETGSFGATNARHRWAYYDGGSNNIQYELALKVFGGAGPHRFTMIAGPSGATVGNIWNAASHGVVKWAPNTSYSTGSPAQFTVRVTGQDGNSIDISWTVATSASIDVGGKFIFLSNSGNNSTGNGSIASPWQSLPKVMGSARTASTYPSCLVVLRGGTYAMSAHSDAWNGGNGSESVKCRVELNAANHPMAYMVYPGENATIDFSGAEITMGINSGGTPAHDFFLSGSSTSRLVISGAATNAAETHNIWGIDNKRFCQQWVDYDAFDARTAGGQTNSVPLFSSGSDSTPAREYWSAHNVREINRTSVDPGANDGLLWILFGVNYWADDYCSGARSGGHPCVSFKDTIYNSSSRYMQIDAPGESNFAVAYMGQSGGGNNEVCYSRLFGPLWFNLQAQSSETDGHSYRNTIYSQDTNYPQAIRMWSAPGPFISTNDCVISSGDPQINALLTSDGTECQSTGASSNKPFNTTTGNLQNVGGQTLWRDLYLGTRGWEIG